MLDHTVYCRAARKARTHGFLMPFSYENTHSLVTHIPYLYEYTFLIYMNTHSVFVWIPVYCRSLKKARTQPYSGKAGVPKLQVRHDMGALYVRHDSSLYGT